MVLRDHLNSLEHHELRLANAETELAALAQSEAYAGAVGRLCCLRGVGALTAMVLLTETFDFHRFGKADKLMGYWGFDICENSSGNRRVQGGITKTGNEHCRWMLVEAGWHYAKAPLLSEGLKKRLEGQPAEVVAHAWKAQVRLHKTFWRVMRNTGCQQKAVVAVARELTGFIWAIMTDHCTPCAAGEAESAPAVAAGSGG